ncbi:MAG TPA: hypothetical protein VIF63_09345 [Candidatus Limnocylindrales bacterium]
MRSISFRLRSVLIALVGLAMSASLTFGAQPPAAASWGLANASSHAGKTVPVADGDVETAGDEETGEEEIGEETGEETGEEEGTEDAGDHCLTDPTGLTEEELAAVNHGSIVCWAAHQTTWPEEFRNHGAFVSSWAHAGKDSASKDAAKAARDAAKDARNAAKGKGN